MQLEKLQTAGVKVVCVGIGSLDSAKLFCDLTKFPADMVYASTTAAPYDALGFAPGFARQAPPALAAPKCVPNSAPTPPCCPLAALADATKGCAAALPTLLHRQRHIRSPKTYSRVHVRARSAIRVQQTPRTGEVRSQSTSLLPPRRTAQTAA